MKRILALSLIGITIIILHQLLDLSYSQSIMWASIAFAIFAVTLAVFNRKQAKVQ